MHTEQITAALRDICKLATIPVYEVVDAQAPHPLEKPKPSPRKTAEPSFLNNFVSIPMSKTIDLFDEKK